MKWSRVGARVLALLWALVAFGQSSLAEEPCCGEKKAEEKSRRADPPPCICPLWAIEDLGGGEFLYYAEYFAPNCAAEPIATELQDFNLPLSPGCAANPNHCQAAYLSRDKAANRYYPGLTSYIAHNDAYELPPGPDGKGTEFSKLLSAHFVSFQPDPRETKLRYAKVFMFQLDRAGRYGDPACKPAVIHVALEMQGSPQGNPHQEFVHCERMENAPITQKCYIFRAVDRSTTPPTQIMLLTKGEVGAEAKE